MLAGPSGVQSFKRSSNVDFSPRSIYTASRAVVRPAARQLGGSAARRPAGLAVRRLSGSAARRAAARHLGGSVAQSLGASPPRRLGGFGGTAVFHRGLLGCAVMFCYSLLHSESFPENMVVDFTTVEFPNV